MIHSFIWKSFQIAFGHSEIINQNPKDMHENRPQLSVMGRMTKQRSWDRYGVHIRVGGTWMRVIISRRRYRSGAPEPATRSQTQQIDTDESDGEVVVGWKWHCHRSTPRSPCLSLSLSLSLRTHRTGHPIYHEHNTEEIKSFLPGTEIRTPIQNKSWAGSGFFFVSGSRTLIC